MLGGAQKARGLPDVCGGAQLVGEKRSHIIWESRCACVLMRVCMLNACMRKRLEDGGSLLVDKTHAHEPQRQI